MVLRMASAARTPAVNLAGRGGSAKIGVLTSIPIVLAPERILTVTGAADSSGPSIAASHVRRLKTRGDVQWSLPLPCR